MTDESEPVKLTPNYIIQIERFGKPRIGLYFGGKLRIEISRDVGTDDDANNNDGQQTACFDLLEDGIHSIRLALAIDQEYVVECRKSNGEEGSGGSVEIIHQRSNGPLQLHDLNEHVQTVRLRPPRSLTSDGLRAYPLMRTFQSNKKTPRIETTYSTFNKEIIISEDDLIKYTRFILRFTRLSTLNVEQEEDFEMEEVDGNTPEEYIHADNGNLYEERNNSEEADDDDDIDNEGEKVQTISFCSVFDNVIRVTIKMKNTLGEVNPYARGGLQSPIRHFNDTSVFSKTGPSHDKDNKFNFKDLATIARAQALFQQQGGPNSLSNNPWLATSNKLFILKKFVKSIVKHRLQSLGIQDLDCNEILDNWEARCHSPFLPFPEDDSFDQFPTCNGGVSPFISKPNSALFQLSPSGHLTKSIFSTFVNQVETLKDILNNATCNLIHMSVWLLLPEIKLLWGRQLETNRNPVFIQEWIQFILLAAIELKPAAPEEVAIMVNKELKKLKILTKDLYKGTKKIYKKIDNLSKFSENAFRQTLVHLNPKSLKKLDAFDKDLRKKYSPDVVHFDPDLLHKINISPLDLFKDHVFLRKSKRGELLIKSDIEGPWEKYCDMDYVDRRARFLALAENLQTTLQSCMNTMHHLKEIYTAGYPGSIKTLLKDVVEELKFTGKRDDLTLLIKTSIVTHVSNLHELLTRLLYISEEVKGITKQFHQCLQPVAFDLKKLKLKYKHRRNPSSEFSDTDTSAFNDPGAGGTEKGSVHLNAHLAIPFYNVNADSPFKPLAI